MITVGLVVEGPHDLLLLKPLIDSEFRRQGIAVQFKELQPYQDATGSYSGGGWPRVMEWCKSHAGSKMSTFFTPLFEGDPACDVILIHLDGDALELAKPHSSVTIPATLGSIDERVRLVGEVLEAWLELSQSTRSRLAFAIPVLQTEAWVLAAEGHVSSESCPSKDIFRSTFSPPGKMAKFYERRIVGALPRVEDIHASCVSYAMFRVEVSKIDLGSSLVFP